MSLVIRTLRFAILILFFLSINLCFSQANYIISPDVISSSGGDFSKFNYNLSFTIGEISTETLQASNVILTQGFHQDYINITSLSENMFTNNVKVYPNPTNSKININLKQGVNIKDLYFIDLNGKKLEPKEYFRNKNTLEINVSNLDIGIYILQVESDREINKVKIIVER